MDINHILKLSRLGLEEKEKKNLEKDFSSILSFVKKIEELNTEGVKPMNYPLDISNVMREDEIKNNKEGMAENKRLIDASPEKKDNYIKVKEVL